MTKFAFRRANVAVAVDRWAGAVLGKIAQRICSTP
jgi:hypothetical protein